MNQKITFIKTIKRFGEERLGLLFDGSFEEMARNAFSCNWVYASQKESMGSLFEHPFEFYDDEEKALKRFKELKAQGYDSYFYHAEAHGGKACPITKEMLSSPRARQCYVVLHEAWHSTSRLNKHNFAYPWEESTGRVVGLFGGIELAQELGDEALLKECIDQEAAWAMFADFVNAAYKRLSDAFSQKVAPEEIEAIKKELNKEAAVLHSKMPESWEKSELNKEINNAFIMRYYSYTVHYPLARKIYVEEKDVKRAMVRFVKEPVSLSE